MIRIGHGYDLHRLQEGDGLSIGGLRIACEHAFIAHSDGDVAIHALCDALLGAAALGDIGRHFPDNDPRWQGADSRQFLREVVIMLLEEGLSVVNADITVIAEVPRLSPHIEPMREILAPLLAVPLSQVNVKATTSEGLGPVGAREAIAAHAVVLVESL